MTKFNAGPRVFYSLGILMLSLIAFTPWADAGCSCSAGNWDPSAFLNSELGISQPVQPGSAQNSAVGSSGSSTQKMLDRPDSFPNKEIFKPMKSVSSSDVVMDVSNGDSYAQSHIQGAIHIPTKDFLDSEGDLKASEELVKVLGGAGLSRDDSVVLYGNKESSGETAFTFWVLSYLGQEDVKLLDGSLADWKAAGLPLESSENKKPAREYMPEVKPKLLADYEYVKSGQAQILDARPFVEFSKGRIPGSIAQDPANIINGDRIKNGGALETVFSRLGKGKPVVVYSDDYSRSSLVWMALQLTGYEASIYTWKDWMLHKSASVKDETALSDADAVSSKYLKLGTT